MKKATWILALAFMVAFNLIGCKEEPPKPKEVTKEQVKEQAAKLVDTAKEALQQQKDKFFQDYNDRLQGLNKKIVDLKAMMATATPEMKEKIQALLNQLDEKQNAIKKLMADSKDATGEAWDKLKTSLDDTYKQMDLTVAKDYLQFQKDKFLQDYNARLQGMNKKIDDLKAQLATATPETKEKLQATLKLMEEKQAGIQKLLADSKDAAGQAWENLKTGLNDLFKTCDTELEKCK
jgi:hypothetical protein